MASSVCQSSSGVPIYNKNHSSISLEQSNNFIINGHVFLSHVPDNITHTPSLSPAGSFVGFHSTQSKNSHVLPIGKLKNIPFMSIFRFKVWWATHWVGSNGRDLQKETQMVVFDKSEGRPYILLLPLLEGQFRASLQSGEDDNIDLCVESGSTKVSAAEFRSVLYMHAGDDPFELVKQAMKVVKVHLGTFRLMEQKTPPGIVDKFGWCTWDALNLNVHPQGIWEGVKALVDGGCPPGLVLIDDGWQSISHDEDPITKEGMNHTVAGKQMPCKLLKFQENHNFKDYVSPKSLAAGSDNNNKGMGAFIKDLKEEFNTVDYVYVGHALCGYWGGLRLNVPGMPETVVIKPAVSPGLGLTMEDKILNNGVGLVPPEMVDPMYEVLHSYLQKLGIDGVKVDVIQAPEMLWEDYGGRVELAKAYYKDLTASMRKHFNGNGVIASMEQCNDFMFLGTEAISLGRVGNDFWCTVPSGDPNGALWFQGCHMVRCAYNSLWMGNFIHPDWDMFPSTHPCAEFHAASRAICGGPIYVSDSVGKHNFPLLKRLVLPDGSILRCQCYALPTRDCLFVDPLHDGKTILKIWNINKFTGVIGAFNCQEKGWCGETRRNKCASRFSHLVTANINPNDIEWNSGNNPISIEGVQVFAMYLSSARKLFRSRPDENKETTLEPFNYELVTVSPVTNLSGKSVEFAPIGLVNMLNTGGALQSLAYNDTDTLVRIGVKGAGEMRVFASEKPIGCRIDGREVEFAYEDDMVVLQVPWSIQSVVSIVEYMF